MKSFPNIEIIKRIEDADSITTFIEPEPLIRLCQHCHSTRVAKKGYENVTYRDVPENGKHSLIKCKRLRFECKECQRSSTEQYAWASNLLPVTRDFIQYVLHESYSKPTTKLIELTGLTRIQVNQVLRQGLEQVDFRHEWLAGTTMQACRFSIQSKPFIALLNPELGTLVDIIQRPCEDNISAMLRRIDSKPIETFIAPIDPVVIRAAENQKNIKKVVITSDVYISHIHRFLMTAMTKTVVPLRTQRGRELFTSGHDTLDEAQCKEIYGLFHQYLRFERLYVLKESLITAMKTEPGHRIAALERWFADADGSLTDTVLPLFLDLKYCSPYLDDSAPVHTTPITPIIDTLSNLIQTENKVMTFPAIRARLLYDLSCIIHDKSTANDKGPTQNKHYLKNNEKERRLLGTEINKLTIRESVSI